MKTYIIIFLVNGKKQERLVEGLDEAKRQAIALGGFILREVR